MKKLSSDSTKQNYDSSFVQELIRCNVILKEHSNKLAEEKRQLRKKYFNLEKNLNIKDKNLFDKEIELEKLKEEIKHLEEIKELKSTTHNYLSSYPCNSPLIIKKNEKSIIDDSLIFNSPRGIENNFLNKNINTTAILLKSEEKNEKKRKNPFLKFDLNNEDEDIEIIENKQVKLSDISKLCFNNNKIDTADSVRVVKPIEHKPISVFKTKSSSSLDNQNSVYKYVYDGLGGHKKLLNSVKETSITNVAVSGNSLLRKNLTKLKVSNR
jgi:hypothetical protein